MRIDACGQTMAHLPQSMQIEASQIGIVGAMARFSKRVVALGKVPSTGSALTGTRSPSPAISLAVTSRTKSGAVAGIRLTSADSALTAPGVTWVIRASDA